MPPAPTAINYNTWADYNGAGTAENAVNTANLSPTNLVRGANVVAVEVHQHDAGSSDLSFDFSLGGQTAPLPLIALLLRFQRQPVVYWTDPAAALWQADQLPGPWTPTAFTNSPAIIPPDQPRQYFHLRK
jgi:hypothetical protein